MQLIKWEPFNEVERFFGDFPLMHVPKFGWDMSIDLYEEKGKMIAKMNIPGVDPEKINVKIEDNMLYISGSREEEKEEKDKHYYGKEIRRGEFERSIRLPKKVDTSYIDAEYKNGTLHVFMPIIEKDKESSVKIKIKS